MCTTLATTTSVFVGPKRNCFAVRLCALRDAVLVALAVCATGCATNAKKAPPKPSAPVQGKVLLQTPYFPSVAKDSPEEHAASQLVYETLLVQSGMEAIRLEAAKQGPDVYARSQASPDRRSLLQLQGVKEQAARALRAERYDEVIDLCTEPLGTGTGRSYFPYVCCVAYWRKGMRDEACAIFCELRAKDLIVHRHLYESLLNPCRCF